MGYPYTLFGQKQKFILMFWLIYAITGLLFSNRNLIYQQTPFKHSICINVIFCLIIPKQIISTKLYFSLWPPKHEILHVGHVY